MKNSIKKIFVFLAMTSSCFSYGAVVNQNAAQTVGANFLISKGVQGVGSTSDLALTYTASTVVNGNTIIDYYVFNATGTKAFVMVSGDDNIIPILAFSSTSSFDINKISPDTKEWIDGYKNQITAAITNNIPAKASSAALWSELTDPAHTAHRIVTATTAVSALVSTTWDQDGGGSVPYNAYCPNTSTTGGLSVTGCVATAMSQVMKFWNWPTVGCGYHTYFDTYNSSEAMGSNTWNSVDYANTAFNWSGMPLGSSNASVATLMYAAGVSVNMSYSADESGSYVDFLETSGVNCAEYALQTYFHYKPSLHNVLRFGVGEGSLGSYYEGQDYEYYHGSINVDSVNEATWVSMLQTELNLGHPMLYEGQGSVGGHCWVLDGWETTDDMFHFNWGWSGESNGYYTVDNLAPPALGTGGGAGNFNYDQGVIMGIVPDSFPTSPTGTIEMLAHLNTANNVPFDYGTPFSITTKIKNAGTTSFSGSFCVQLFDTGNHFLTNLDTVTGVTITAGDSSAALTFNCNSYAVTSQIFSGISIAYQATGTSTWTTVTNNGSFINYGIVAALNDTNVALFDSLHVGSHTIAQGSPLTVTTKVGNNGYGGSVNAAVEAILVNTATGATFTVQSHASASLSTSGTSYTFTNPDISVAAGLYALEIKHQYSSSGSYYTTSGDYYTNPILLTVTCAPSPGTITGIPAVCMGTTITLGDTALAGTGTWTSTNTSIATINSSGVVSGLTEGLDTIKYTVSNSCGDASVTTLLSVDVLPVPAAVTGPDTVCIGGVITLADLTSGGTWSSSTGLTTVDGSGDVTGVTSGNETIVYSVTNVCGTGTSSLGIYVSPVAFPVSGTITGTTVACLTGMITLADTASGGSGMWSSANSGVATVSGGSVTGVAAGTTTITYSVTNSCGTASSSAVVTFDVLPIVAAISGADSACVSSGSTTLADATTGGTWIMSNTDASITSGGVVSGVSLGVDTALYIVTNVCGSDTSLLTMVVIDCVTGVNNVAQQSDVITLYPNPTQNSISISSTGMIKTVVVSNVFGQEVFNGKYANNKEVEVSMNQMPAGIYMVRVNEDKVYKVVKQ